MLRILLLSLETLPPTAHGMQSLPQMSWVFDKCELHFQKSMLFCYLNMGKLGKTRHFYISLLLSLKQFRYSLLTMLCAPHI